jgi:uncharacterized protein (TIGR02246 family)
MALAPLDTEQLRELSHRYASAVDTCDFERLATVFAPEATLITGLGETRGRDNIMAAMHKLERFDRTFHMLGQLQFASTGADTASGELYCIAHHYTASEAGTDDMVMHIIYNDTYVHVDNEWCIDLRRLDVVHQHTTTHTVPPPTTTHSAPPPTPPTPAAGA